jgi:hypothetical protein
MGFIEDVCQADTENMWRRGRQLVKELYNSNRGQAADEVFAILVRCGMEGDDMEQCSIWKFEFEGRQGEAIQYLVRNGAKEEDAERMVDSMATYR